MHTVRSEKKLPDSDLRYCCKSPLITVRIYRITTLLIEISHEDHCLRRFESHVNYREPLSVDVAQDSRPLVEGRTRLQSQPTPSDLSRLCVICLLHMPN